MRILSVNATLDPVSGGGTAERTIQLARNFAEAGLDTTVLSLNIGLDASHSRARLGEASLRLLPCINRRYLVPQPRTREIAEAVAGADIVHLCNHWTALNALVYRAARMLAKPYVVCPAGALRMFGRSLYLKRSYNCIVGQALVARASGWVAITPYERLEFAAYGVPSSRVAVIPNGIDIREFIDGDTALFRTQHRLGDSRFILFVGRLHEIKGPDLLLRAFATIRTSFPDCHLVFAGPDDGMLVSLRRMTTELRIAEKVHFIGFVGGLEKVSAYRAASIVVIPSRQEAMSLVVLEAGACEKPVILTDACGFDEVASCNGGEVVQANVEALAAGLYRMLSTNDREDRGRRLFDLVSRQYSWHSAVVRYVALFQEILGNHKAKRCGSSS